jgi:hypothetical protein
LLSIEFILDIYSGRANTARQPGSPDAEYRLPIADDTITRSFSSKLPPPPSLHFTSRRHNLDEFHLLQATLPYQLLSAFGTYFIYITMRTPGEYHTSPQLRRTSAL